MSDKENIFIDGMFIESPHPNAPDYVKGSISVRLKKFFTFAKEHQKGEWLNIDIKKSKAGKLYLTLNTFVPKKKVEEKEDIPEINIDDLGEEEDQAGFEDQGDNEEW